jgi:hypothetical protein
VKVGPCADKSANGHAKLSKISVKAKDLKLQEIQV